MAAWGKWSLDGAVLSAPPRPISACPLAGIRQRAGIARACIIVRAGSWVALIGPGATEPARCFEQPVVIGPAAGAALKVDRRAGVNPSRILPSELQLDVGVEDLGANDAARISILGAQKPIEVAKIGHRAASFLSDRCPGAAILVSSLAW